MSDIPTTEDVQHAWTDRVKGNGARVVMEQLAFDAWLQAHDDQVRADILEAAAAKLAEHHKMEVSSGVLGFAETVYDFGPKIADARGAIQWLRARAVEYRKGTPMIKDTPLRFVVVNRPRIFGYSAAVRDATTGRWAPFIDESLAAYAAAGLNMGFMQVGDYVGWRDDG